MVIFGLQTSDGILELMPKFVVTLLQTLPVLRKEDDLVFGELMKCLKSRPFFHRAMQFLRPFQTHLKGFLAMRDFPNCNPTIPVPAVHAVDQPGTFERC